MRLAFSSKADRGNRLKGEKRGPGRNLLSIGGGRENPHRVEECSSPGNRVELARSAFRNGKHCCTLYPGLHKPGTPHSANSRGLLSSREFSMMIQERVIFLREIRQFSCVEQKEMFERV